MSKYVYDGSGRFYPGLPACDFDDAELSEAQRSLLRDAVASGVYRIAEPEPLADPKPVEADAPKPKGKAKASDE